MTLPNLVEAIPAMTGAGIGLGGGFFIVKFLFEWAGGRVDKREAASIATAERLDAATYKLIQTLEGRLNEQDARLNRVEGELIQCRAQHAQCELELGRLRAIVQGLGDVRQTAATIVAAERVVDRAVAKIGEQMKGDKG